MLSEIYCDKFYQKTIRFREGLNVVLGTPDADNSIGKSTLLLIVDYAFGGDTYARASDIVKNIGEHKIGFKFQFEDGEYAFLRAVPDSAKIWRCDSDYRPLDLITKERFTEWLSKKYELDLYQLSFRDAVGRYIRVYGKDNYDEKHPLNITSKEPNQKAKKALLKLFDGYKVLSDYEKVANEAKEECQTYKKAQENNFIVKIGKRQYEKNEKEVTNKKKEIEELTQKLDKGLLDIDTSASERAIELKRELTPQKRMRSKLHNKIALLDENLNYTFSETTESFEQLKQFFPSVNIKHLSEIETFHKKIATIFDAELQEERKRTQKQLDEVNKDIQLLENELSGLIKNPKLSTVVLQKYAETLTQIEKMQQENEAYRKRVLLDERNKTASKNLERVQKEQYGGVEATINSEMERINATLYSEKANPPILHLEGNSYDFFTQDDTGTGIAYKGLVVYDLAIASLTKLPILVHDSLILKQISDEAVENILVRYMESGKQVIISLDKQDSYSKRTAEILEKQCVLHLAPNGRELFGRAWSRQET